MGLLRDAGISTINAVVHHSIMVIAVHIISDMIVRRVRSQTAIIIVCNSIGSRRRERRKSYSHGLK